jgi:uncharacterized protein YecE (DUF72 family)
VELHVGTSGFSYKEWKGTFYPDDLPAGEMLHYYGERLGSVEINSTFYRMPKPSVLETWSGQVPATFRFSIKASMKITHRKRLEDAGEETGYLVETVRALGSRLGVLLFQLPPNLKEDAARLEAFLEILPPDIPTAFEFRHPSWGNDRVHTLLHAHGAALCQADTEEAPLEAPLVATAPFGYLRLRRPDYDEGALSRWAERIRSQPWDRAFVFFKHEDEGAGPRMARTFLETAGRG